MVGGTKPFEGNLFLTLETDNCKDNYLFAPIRSSIMGYGLLTTVALLTLRCIGAFAQDVRFLPEATWQQADFSYRQTRRSKTLLILLT